MKKIIMGTLILAIMAFVPVSARADVNVHVGIALPPAIVFSAPPVTVVIPGTYVYAVPDVPVDIFFYGGWWWRPWQGYWYRSRYYDRGWVYYEGRPVFYSRIPPQWRDYYRERRWEGYPWHYKKVPYHQLQRNWKGWEKRNYWERRQYWGVPELKAKQHFKQPPGSAPPVYQHRPPEMNPPQSRPQPREMNHPQSRPQSHEVNRIDDRNQRREDKPPEIRPQSREVHERDSQDRRGGHERREEGKGHGKGKPEKWQGDEGGKGNKNGRK